MKKLIIIRDAKSDEENQGVDDFERTLNDKGLKESIYIGKSLKNQNIIPDLILSSPALRALSTAEIIAKEIGYTKEIIQNQYIYEAYVNSLQEIVSYIHDTNDTVFLIGHNPGVSALAYMLCGLKQSIPNAASVEINFNVDSWMEVSKENSELISYDFPNKDI